MPVSRPVFRRSLIAAAILAHLPASAQAADAAADDAVTLQAVSVTGKGESRQVQTVTREDLAQSAPGTSPIKVVQKLPGVNYQAADPFGAYEWAVRITVRGFNQNQMGFTLDDIPLGDMSYGNTNGLHISRAIISENIGRTVLSQGTGSVGTASTSNLGGTLQFYSADPTNKAGAEVSQTLGSNSQTRSYVRLDSGQFSTGTKGYFSYVHQDQQKWKGDGHQKYDQFNLKIVQSLAAATRLSLFADYSNRKEIDYQDLSKEMIGKLGYGWDNYYPDWNAAIAAAQGVYTRGEQNVDSPLDAAYYAGSGLRRDFLTGLALNSKLADGLILKSTLYTHRDIGRGLWYTPYVASPNGTPISLRTTEYSIARWGSVSTLAYTLDAHRIEGGFWYESNHFDQARRFYSLNLASPGIEPYDYADNEFATQWQYLFKTTTLQMHLQDTWQITDSLSANAGFKSQNVRTSSTTVVGTPVLNGEIKTERNFLPQAGVVWALSPQDEVFLGAARNMRAFPASHTGTSPFATTQAGFDAIKGSVQPETSWTYETGYRFNHKAFDGVVSIYHVDFSDRLLGVSSGAGIVGNPTIIQNVGSVATNGAELSGLWRFYPGASWYNAVSYNQSEYQSDVQNANGTTVATSGKQVVDTPEWMYKTQLSYERNGYFANLNGNYTGKRYYTYTNDNDAPGAMIWDLGGGYRLDKVSVFKSISLQANVYNVFGKEYISSIGTNGFSNSDPNGTAQTLMVGAPRQFFISLGAKF